MAKYKFTYVESRDEPYIFSDIEYPQDKTVQFDLQFSDATRWDNVMLEFARFLDAVGYVGVHEKMDTYLAEIWEPINKLCDEDTSNSGLSD